MVHYITLAGLLLVNFLTFAQPTSTKFTETEVSIDLKQYTLYGTLTLPTQKVKKMKVALFIAGSGPTDRNGNNTMGLKSDAYQQLCYALAEQGIATLRFDKLGSGKSIPNNLKELAEQRDFENEVNDVVAWIAYLEKDKRFGEIQLIAHSQGSLIGSLAIQKTGKTVTKYISLAGLGRRGSETLKEQLGAQPAFVSEAANPIIDSLVQGHKVKNVPQYLEVLFRASMQPYLISWFKYDPADELAKLQIPSLVIQGTHDIQIKVADAQYLVSKSPKATLQLIEKMNHIFKYVESEDKTLNIATYSKPELPIVPELIALMSKFMVK